MTPELKTYSYYYRTVLYLRLCSYSGKNVSRLVARPGRNDNVIELQSNTIATIAVTQGHVQ